MKKAFLILLLALVIALSFLSCGGEIGTGVSNPPTKAAAAVTALFSSDENSSNVNEFVKIPAQLINKIIKTALAQENPSEACDLTEPGCTCEYTGVANSPSNVTDVLFGNGGTFGSVNNSVTLESDDYCENSDGTENPNIGPDSNGIFAGFYLNGDITGTCTSGTGTATTVIMKGEAEGTSSSGVWRNLYATDTTPSYNPQIFGSFVFEINGTQTEVNCTIYLTEGGTTSFANCSDSTGISIDQDSDATCTFPDDV